MKQYKQDSEIILTSTLSIRKNMQSIYFKRANIRSTVTKLLKARGLRGALKHFKSPLSGNPK